MGADMTVAFASLENDAQFWYDGIARLSDDAVLAFASEYDGMSVLPESNEPKDIRQAMVDAVEMSYSDSREISVCTINGERFAITGGLSWGDEPTDAYPYVLLFNWIQEDEIIPDA